MSNKTIVSTRVDDELLAMIDQIAAAQDRSRAWIVNKLLETAARKEIEFMEFIQVGLDDIAAGRTIPHEEMIGRLRSRWAQRKAA